MMENDKKLLVFKKDCDNGDVLGQTYFVKFLDEDKTCAIFYKPLIAPRYFKEYIKENEIEEAYEIKSNDKLLKYYDKIYTFKSEGGVYFVNKKVDITEKLVLLVDKGMEIDIDLPKFSYEVDQNTIILSKYKKNKYCGYCYVSTPSIVNEDLKKIMISAQEVIPNVLSFVSYNFDVISKKKKK